MSNTEKNSLNNTTDVAKSGITKPSFELEDFYSLLDPKVVEKIKQTSKENRERIMNDVKQYEYDLEGAKNILDLLK